MKILFIGNSHTFFNDMPKMLSLMAQSRGLDFDTVQNTSGGKGLDWHAGQPDVRFNILYGGYDVIVLQHMAHPFPGEQSLLDGAGQLMAYIACTPARVVSYMPWSARDNPQGQAEMIAAHEALAARYPGLALAPAGRVWDYIRHSHREIELYYHDGHHASPIGSWLVAATLLRTLTGESAQGLPTHLDMGRPTFQGLTLTPRLAQDFACPTSYTLDAAACGAIARAVDRLVPPGWQQ